MIVFRSSSSSSGVVRRERRARRAAPAAVVGAGANGEITAGAPVGGAADHGRLFSPKVGLTRRDEAYDATEKNTQTHTIGARVGGSVLRSGNHADTKAANFATLSCPVLSCCTVVARH